MKKTIVPIILAASLVVLIVGASLLYSAYGETQGGGQLIVPTNGSSATGTTVTVTEAATTTVFTGSTVTVADRPEVTTQPIGGGAQTETVTATTTQPIGGGVQTEAVTTTATTTATKAEATTTKVGMTKTTASLVKTTVAATTAAPTTTTQAKPPRTEKKAPDFTVYDENGNTVKLSDYAGRPIVLNFWASWCPPCKREMPDFQKKYEQYGDEVQFLMVNLTVGSETVKTVKAFVEKNGYTFPVLYDRQQSAVYAYDIYSIPATFFIDAEGYIMGQATGAINEATLQQGIDLIH